MKLKLYSTQPAAASESRWREQHETGKLRRAVEREMRERYDRWEDR